MRNSKNPLAIIIGLILILLVGYVAYASMVKNKVTTADSQVVCTMDAMECPDGSFVGRSGPDCQFVCPVTSTSTGTGATTGGSKNPVLVEIKLNETASPLGETITPLSLVEDSRCPVDVQCIQAGTVRVLTKLNSALGESTQIMKLGTPVTTESETITLISVSPDKNSKTSIASSSYRFTFQVAKR